MHKNVAYFKSGQKELEQISTRKFYYREVYIYDTLGTDTSMYLQRERESVCVGVCVCVCKCVSRKRGIICVCVCICVVSRWRSCVRVFVCAHLCVVSL